MKNENNEINDEIIKTYAFAISIIALVLLLSIVALVAYVKVLKTEGQDLRYALNFAYVLLRIQNGTQNRK